jgi:hypothetical protein
MTIIVSPKQWDDRLEAGKRLGKAEMLERIKKLLNHLHSDQYPNFFVLNSFHDAFPELSNSQKSVEKKEE